MGTSKKSTKRSLENLYSYDDILLKTYFDISMDGNVTRLIKYGKADNQTLQDCWERLVKRNNEETGNFNYFIYKEGLEVYHNLLRVYHKVKTCLLKLSIRCDYKVIGMLAAEGYVIDKRVSHYDESLYLASRKSDNLITKIQSKRKELAEFEKKDGGVPMTFEKALAKVSFGAKYQVQRDVTLSGYNELVKEIKNAKSHGSRNR